MLIAGLLSLVQIVYLPGALLRRCFESKESDPLEQAAYTFGLSLIANTWLVAILVALHAYSRWVIWTIVIGEIAVLIFLKLRSARPNMYVYWETGDLPLVVPPRTFSAALGIILALTTVAIFGYICYLNWGTVFSDNDDVASWDRWATEWAVGKFPTRTSWYPQLMPSNWSLTYVLLGRQDVKMFAKATTALYPLLTLFLFGSLAIARRGVAFLFGAAAYGWLLLHYLGIAFMMIGYADVPVAFFGFLTFHSLYRRTALTVSRNDLLLALVFGTGTLLTKQGGVYALVAVLLYAIWMTRRRPEASPFKARNQAAAIALFALCFAAIWYGGKALQVSGGHDYSNLTLLTRDIYHGRGYGERLIAAGMRFWTFRGEDAGSVVTLVSVFLLLGSLLLRSARWITLLLILPFLLLWGFLFSYEIRNASLVFPLIALVSGMVIDWGLSRLMKPLDGITFGSTTMGALLAVLAVLCFSGWVLFGKPGVSMLPSGALAFAANEWIAYAMSFYALGFAVFGLLLLLPMIFTAGSGRLAILWPIPAAGLLVLVGLGMVKYQDDKIVDSQHALERRIGTPAINERIYAAVQARAIHQPIMTDYWFLQFLPGLESLFRPLPCGSPCSYEELKRASASQPDAGYFLMYDHDFDPGTLKKLPSSRGFHTVFTEQGVRLLAINRAAIDVQNRPPEVLNVTPASGAGSRNTFRFSYSDPDGISDITSVIVIINVSPTGSRACYLQWYRATGTVSLANDNGVGWAAEEKPGVPGSIHNSQCELFLPGTSVTETNERLELNLDLRFLPSFAGLKHVYTDVFDDYNATSGYRDLAQWYVK